MYRITLKKLGVIFLSIKHTLFLNVLSVNLNMSEYKLDRTSFKAHTVNEAANHKQYYSSLSWQERLKITAYLNSVAFNYDINNPPKLDRTIFSVRSRNK